MGFLIQILYALSTALMAPVIVLLLALLVWAALLLGGLFGEWRDRRRGRERLRRVLSDLEAGRAEGGRSAAELLDLLGGTGSGAERFLSQAARCGAESDPVVLGKLADDIQLELEGRIGKASLGTRLGPMLGLMGTLIPMGPALTGLAAGNVEVMSRNLVVAFSTTVLGILVGGICHLVAVARGRWYARDGSDIEFLHDWLLRPGREGAEGGSSDS